MFLYIYRLKCSKAINGLDKVGYKIFSIHKLWFRSPPELVSKTDSFMITSLNTCAKIVRLIVAVYKQNSLILWTKDLYYQFYFNSWVCQYSYAHNKLSFIAGGSSQVVGDQLMVESRQRGERRLLRRLIAVQLCQQQQQQARQQQ